MDVIEKVNESVNELEKESDRACIILAASIIDDLLFKLLDHHLVPYPGSNDPIFSNNGPLSTFSNKINLAYRLGLISDKMSKTIHWIRKIRNVAAHEYQTVNFDSQKVKDITENIFNSTKLTKAIVKKNSSTELSTRKKFIFASSWLIYYFNQLLTDIPTLEGRELEGGLSKKSSEWYKKMKESETSD